MNLLNTAAKLCAFLDVPRENVSEAMVKMVEEKLTRQQWWQYSIELEQILLNEIDSHLHCLPPNLSQGKAILMLRAETEEKALALSLVIR